MAAENGVQRTAHEETEVDLLASNARLRAVFNSMEEGVVLHDESGAVIKTNAAAQRILNVDGPAMEKQSAHGPPLAPLIRRDGSAMPDDERPAARVLRTGEAIKGRIMGLTSPGKRTTWLSVNATPLRLVPDGPMTGAVVTFRDITEEVVLQEALEQSLGNFGALMASLPVGIAVSHGKTMRYVNQALVTILGYDSASELEGRETMDVIHPRSEAAILERYAGMANGRHPGPGILECRRRDGSAVLVEVTSMPSIFEGKPAILAMIRDVTEATEARRAQELSELRFRTLVTSAPVGIFETNLQGHCVFANDQACRLVGLPIDEFLGEGWLKTVHPDDVPNVQKNRIEARAAGRGLQHELRFIHANKTVVVRVEAVPLMIDGKLSGFLGAMVDLTALHAAQRALAKSEASFRQLAENAPLGIAVRNGPEVMFMNPAMKQIIGADITGGNLVTTTAVEVSPTTKTQIEARLAATAAGDGVPAEVFAFRRRDGTAMVIEVDSINVEFRGAPATMSLIRDITELDRARADRNAAHAALVESLAQKETLLKEIHHRVKNNLQVIASLLRLGRGYVADPAALSIFNDSIGRLHSMALIHEHLYQSQDLGNIEMSGYLRNLVNELVRANTTQHRVAAHVTADRIFLNMNRCVPLGLIVSELINNALKHAFREASVVQPALEISLSEDLVNYELVVRDNGVGIAPAKLQENSLGLRLVASLVKQLGGTHHLEQRQGTVCRVVFPVRPVDR